jgi:predicted transcriptional regulator
VVQRLVGELRSAAGPVQVRDLAERLGMQPSALSGMLEVLERKGVLTLAGAGPTAGDEACGAACGGTCVGVAGCPFIADVGGAGSLLIS